MSARAMRQHSCARAKQSARTAGCGGRPHTPGEVLRLRAGDGAMGLYLSEASSVRRTGHSTRRQRQRATGRCARSCHPVFAAVFARNSVVVGEGGGRGGGCFSNKVFAVDYIRSGAPSDTGHGCAPSAHTFGNGALVRVCGQDGHGGVFGGLRKGDIRGTQLH